MQHIDKSAVGTISEYSYQRKYQRAPVAVTLSVYWPGRGRGPNCKLL